MRLFSQIHDYYDHQSLGQSRARVGPAAGADTRGGSAARSIAAGWRRAERLPLRVPALRYIVCCQTQVRGGENQGVARGIYITLSLSIRPITSNRVGETEVR